MDNWAWSLSLIGLTIAMHATGVTVMVSALDRYRLRLGRQAHGLTHVAAIAIAVFTAMGLSLAVLHGIEAAFWAAAYAWLGAFDSYGAALLYSLDSMATRGASGAVLPPSLQILGALEAGDGMLLFGISAACIFTVMQFYFQNLVIERPGGSIPAK